MDAPKTLQEYFEQNWQGGIEHKPYPIIDHALRITLEPDGRFSFYIHPASTGGITTDFVVDGNTVIERSCLPGPTQKIVNMQAHCRRAKEK